MRDYVPVNPQAVYETTWWEYIRDAQGELTMSPFVEGVASPMMRPLGGGEPRRCRDLPTGALWVLDRKADQPRDAWPRAGADGLAIACKLADRVWYIEGRASNCDKRTDDDHRCWVRQGTVGERLTVDKAGLTCGAGAGSIFMGANNEWHGFLRNGKLTP